MMKRRLLTLLVSLCVPGGCASLNFDRSAERWLDNYCLKEPLDRRCADRRPGGGPAPGDL